MILVPVNAFSNVFGEIALLAVGVENLSEIAVLFTGSNSVQADVELLAVSRVGISGVGLLDGLSGGQLGASETIFQKFFTDAASSANSGLPGADTSSIIEVEAGWADIVLRLAIDTVNELVALRRIRVLEDTVLAGALSITLGRLEFCAVLTVDVVHVVAFVA